MFKQWKSLYSWNCFRKLKKYIFYFNKYSSFLIAKALQESISILYTRKNLRTIFEFSFCRTEKIFFLKIVTSVTSSTHLINVLSFNLNEQKKKHYNVIRHFPVYTVPYIIYRYLRLFTYVQTHLKYLYITPTWLFRKCVDVNSKIRRTSKHPPEKYKMLNRLVSYKMVSVNILCIIFSL